MPYIKQEDRTRYSAIEETIFRSWFDKEPNAGELNYLFTVIIDHYMVSKGEKYQHYNDVIGALEGCKLELYRRVVAPYEDEKLEENGDV